MARTPTTPTNSKYTLSVKKSEKGGVSVYGLQKFPVTLYKDQWQALLARAEALNTFINANASTLINKPATSGGVTGTTSL